MADISGAMTHKGPEMPSDTTQEGIRPSLSCTNSSGSGQTATSTNRAPSHTLSSTTAMTTDIAATQSRKSRLADVGTTGGTVERASLSMPPPVTKPISIYKPANARRPPSFLRAAEGEERPNAGSEAVKDDVNTTDLQPTGGEELRKTSSLTPSQNSAIDGAGAILPEGSTRPPGMGSGRPNDRLSFSSLYSLSSVIHGGVTSASQSGPSSNAGSVKSGSSEPVIPLTMPLSPALGAAKSDAISSPTTATDNVMVTANSEAIHQVVPPVSAPSTKPPITGASRHLDSWGSRSGSTRRSRSKHAKTSPSSAVGSNAVSPSSSDRIKATSLGRVGVCALDVKARSKASRNILTRLSANGEFEVIIFGDKVILDEDVENWPKCDFLISFFSDGFPLDKAIAYQALRKPFVVNDLSMQKILWDRRICLRILDKVGVPTPQRIEVNRDGGPTIESASLADQLYRFSGVKLEGPESGTGGGMKKPQTVLLMDDQDTLVVDGVTMRKPFVEKPTSGEDHNIHIYFPKTHASGGGRRLFRKIGNKSSEWDQNLVIPRAITEEGSSYLYEKFLSVDNAEDIKAYTVGPEYCHAETRTSPVVDGLVRRNTHGKEIRYICKLNADEQAIARKITYGFGQRVCGFDMLRVKNQSFVIDVNGWSFVKDNNDYYDRCAGILKEMFTSERHRKEIATNISPPPDEKAADRSTSDSASSEATPHRKPTIGGHRSDFVKKLMKSPSMSMLRGGNPTGPANNINNAGEVVTSPVALSSPPSLSKIHDGPVANLQSQALPGELPPSSVPLDARLPPAIKATPANDAPPESAPEPAAKHSWKLKGMVSVIRHADRTPKQKYKFTFHTEPFVKLLRGHQEEVLLKGESALNSVLEAAKVALKEGIEDPVKLNLLRNALTRKGAWTGTKVQIKPMFRKRRPEEVTKLKNEIVESVGPESLEAVENPAEDVTDEPESLSRSHTRSDSIAGTTLSRFSAAENDLVVDKLQLVVKWGGEPTHAARYQSQELGENMRADLSLMNKEVLENVRVFTSSEKRVTTSAQIWAASFLDKQDIPESFIKVRKDLLDDSNAAKDVMDKVKKKLKLLLREGHEAPPQFAWPPNTAEPSQVVRQVAELMTYHRNVMRQNFKRLENSTASASLSAISKGHENAMSDAVSIPKALAQAQTLASIQPRWCCGENPELFKERWEKLFVEFCDSEKIDPSKISELYDTMKFDALHNRQFLEWVFTPVHAEDGAEDEKTSADAMSERSSHSSHSVRRHERKHSSGEKTVDRPADKPSSANLAQRIGFRRRSVLNPVVPHTVPDGEYPESYFKLYSNNGQTKAKQDVRLHQLRELYKYAKVLFDFVCPQEYGISNAEKLEIGLLTSLPLLKEIVHDLEEVQASDDAKSFVYFTKESHIYTLLNCILEGGIKTKIERNAIPELDYLSTITFELYEAEDKDADVFSYSIRISITPGCHTYDPLDVQLDSKHSIGCVPRRSLTQHEDWLAVIETLRAKFHTVKLPKSFLAVNVSDVDDVETSDGKSVE